MKDLRFGDLVRNSGRPSTLTLWTAPKKSSELQSAIRANQILTLRQTNVGNKRDFGLVGFHPAREARFLLFPRPLAAEVNQRVIVINYALIDEPAPADPVPAPAVKSKAGHRIKRTKAPVAVPQPKAKRFTVTVRSRATIEKDTVVEAANQSEARAEALKLSNQSPRDQPQWEDSVVRVSSEQAVSSIRS